MRHTRNSRREFLNKLCCLAASGGAAALIPQLRMMSTALAASPLSGYKALVCVYLNGGNDGWNLMVPFDAQRFATYTASRSGTYAASGNPGGLGLALPTAGTQTTQQKIVDANDPSSTTNQYFLHPSLTPANTANIAGASMTDLFSQGHLAFAVNVGPLVKPIQMSDYKQSSANRPPQLFSHADQTNQWHQGNTSESTSLGWGGLCAENLQGQGANTSGSTHLPLAISIAGANRFEIGATSVPYQISSNGLAALSGTCNPTPCPQGTGVNTSSERDVALTSLLTEAYPSVFSDNYGQVFQLGRELSNVLTPLLKAVTLTTPFPANNSLASQLQMVAKMIKVSMTNQPTPFASRQVYFVQIGGFDLHSGMMSGGSDHAVLLSQLSSALSAFWTSMGPNDVNAQDDVTAFTVSEFARTLQSNGAGSDHGWGNLHMVLGGAVKGGKLYSDGGGPIKGFPDQSLTAANNFSRGQMIPGIGVEQYAATLAQWMGVTSSDLNTIFPNLSNFSSNNLGFI
jgi:uncharacterized protein (DUF1501 family)